jgi:hypothetical protein
LSACTQGQILDAIADEHRGNYRAKGLQIWIEACERVEAGIEPGDDEPNPPEDKGS